MKGQENDPINEVSLAHLLGLTNDVPVEIHVGKPPRDKKSVKRHVFNKRVRQK
jgi:hypothetical protein